MKAFALAALAGMAAMGSAGQAGTVLRYDYQGHDLVPTIWSEWAQEEGILICEGECTTRPGMTGWIEIDVDKIAPYWITDMTFRQTASNMLGVQQTIDYTIYVDEKPQTVTFSKNCADLEWSDCSVPLPDWLNFEFYGLMPSDVETIGTHDYAYEFSFSIDSMWRISSWFALAGGNYHVCGGILSSNTGVESCYDRDDRRLYDSYNDADVPLFAADQPGTWKASVIPAPVPLPAGAPLLLAGTAALFGMAKLRRRSSRDHQA
ncbi:hypothetical protein CG51_16640 [Haematobacter missouriensis]|uniref:VPLPA-CTERM sorting domain-containing protein n=1 Tax=Haematobacter missouriensis TaxID=366616 RepID=A0A212AYH0_9RHOB|nr:VPLPA-CTERM sorting domain-containing protein [Haematobacter missouriensis]KFI33200.1 hypothetical protein CG51_16640 [Haematobacter missouriensis]OWJ78644.1 hypothetical protein CDV53_03035 [Haematobacter missouriensis]OWJ86476.1 hypothetical protein CDV52_00500 [Haematobacter missouriensis]